MAQPKVVILKGASGAGKSRVVEWLGERAHEVGAATPLHAHHSGDPGPAHGLAAMLMRHLRCAGLSRIALRNRLAALLHAQGSDDPEDWEALTELMLPATNEDDAGSHTVRFFSLIERHLVLNRQLERMAVERSVILWLDDVEWGYEAIEFVQWLVERGRGAFLVLMTTCDEELSQRPVESALLEELALHERVETVEIGPLDTASHRKLVRGLLSLDPTLAKQIEARTVGNPMFAIQLVQDWVARELLEEGPRGYRLKQGTRIELPANLGEVWGSRVARLLMDRPAMDGVGLELAAVLGQEVLNQEWEALCRLAEVRVDDGLRSELMRSRLIRPLGNNDNDAWTFVHGMLREALERHAVENGRLRGHHLLVGTMLRARGVTGERLAHHLRAGGDLEGALGPYKDTVERHLAESDHHAAEVVFNNWFDILVELDHPADHERWYEAKLARARIASIRGALSEAETLVGEVLPVANAQNWIDLAVECHLLQALLSLNQARFPESLERTSEFETLVPPTERPAQRALCFWYRARAQASLGKLTDALEAFKEAERFFLLTDNVVRAAHCLLGQARIACQQGAHGEAVKLAEGARFDLERAGSRVGVADALNDLGELARLVGDFPAAEAHYRQARRRYEQVGSPHIIYAELNLAAVLLARKFFLEAKVFSEKVLEVARRQGRRLHMTVAHVFLLSTSAQDHDWDSWDAHLRQVRALIKQTKVVDIDIAHHLRAAADLAATAGQQGRASEVFGLSLEQWNAMDREDEVIATAERMKALEIEKK